MRSSTTSGITLIEVIAGLTLMGSLLTVILVSGSQHLRQLKAAERKRESVRMLDDFLASWSVSDFSPDQIPRAVQSSGLAATGQFGVFGLKESRQAGLGYQVQLRRVRKSEFQIGSVVRLTVSAPHAARGRAPTAWAEILIPEQ